MLARCGAQIRIEVIDRATGRLCDTDLSDVFLEVGETPAALAAATA